MLEPGKHRHGTSHAAPMSDTNSERTRVDSCRSRVWSCPRSICDGRGEKSTRRRRGRGIKEIESIFRFFKFLMGSW